MDQQKADRVIAGLYDRESTEQENSGYLAGLVNGIELAKRRPDIAYPIVQAATIAIPEMNEKFDLVMDELVENVGKLLRGESIH